MLVLNTLYIVSSFFFFFFNDTATTEIYTLSLHDALPISKFTPAEERGEVMRRCKVCGEQFEALFSFCPIDGDRKSTRLNSSHMSISYAVFCLKKKKHRRTRDDARPRSGTGVARTPGAGSV